MYCCCFSEKPAKRYCEFPILILPRDPRYLDPKICSNEYFQPEARKEMSGPGNTGISGFRNAAKTIGVSNAFTSGVKNVGGGGGVRAEIQGKNISKLMKELKKQRNLENQQRISHDIQGSRDEPPKPVISALLPGLKERSKSKTTLRGKPKFSKRQKTAEVILGRKNESSENSDDKSKTKVNLLSQNRKNINV